MEFISEERLKKEKEAASGGTNAEPSDSKEGNVRERCTGKMYVVKRPTNVSLLRTYKHSWKARNNHFQRYTDVKVREERRSSVTELASQRQVVQRVKGWKIYHLSTQFEDLVSYFYSKSLPLRASTELDPNSIIILCRFT